MDDTTGSKPAPTTSSLDSSPTKRRKRKPKPSDDGLPTKLPVGQEDALIKDAFFACKRLGVTRTCRSVGAMVARMLGGHGIRKYYVEQWMRNNKDLYPDFPHGGTNGGQNGGKTGTRSGTRNRRQSPVNTAVVDASGDKPGDKTGTKRGPRARDVLGTPISLSKSVGDDGAKAQNEPGRTPGGLMLLPEVEKMRQRLQDEWDAKQKPRP